MIRIAVCDDDRADCQRAEQLCREFTGSKKLSSVQIETFTNPTDMLADIESGKAFDLILCDVYMPGLLGTEAIQELRDNNDDVHVIFLTTSHDHAYDAFGLHADNYLLKPYSFDQFSAALEKSLGQIEKERRSAIPIKGRDGLYRIKYDDMLFSETSDHDQVIHLQNGSTITTRSSSQALFDRLSEDKRFFKAGSSYIVNLDNIQSIQGRDVFFPSGVIITVPARCRKDLEDAFFEFSFEDM